MLSWKATSSSMAKGTAWHTGSRQTRLVVYSGESQVTENLTEDNYVIHVYFSVLKNAGSQERKDQCDLFCTHRCVQ